MTFSKWEILQEVMDTAEFVESSRRLYNPIYYQKMNLKSRVFAFLAGEMGDNEFKAQAKNLVENVEEVFDTILQMC